MVSGGGGGGGGAALLGAYELGRTVGEGSFGKVKQARHRGTGALFAVKILDRARVLSQRIADQIRREIATLKLLRHPNVVRLHEVRPFSTPCRLATPCTHRRWIRPLIDPPAI